MWLQYMAECEREQSTILVFCCVNNSHETWRPKTKYKATEGNMLILQPYKVRPTQRRLVQDTELAWVPTYNPGILAYNPGSPVQSQNQRPLSSPEYALGSKRDIRVSAPAGGVLPRVALPL